MKAAEITTEMLTLQQNVASATLRDKYNADTKLTKINQLKVTNQWRKIMRMAKTEALKSEIQILAQMHERNVDRKDAILQSLIVDMQDAEDQLQDATRSHLKNIDDIIAINDGALKELDHTYQSHMRLVKQDFNVKMLQLKEKFNIEREDFKKIINAIDKEESFKQDEAIQYFEQQREEVRNKSIEDINMLRITLDSQIEDLEQQFETAHLNYMQQTGQRTIEYKELTANDKVISDDIEKKKKKVDSLQMLLLQWRGKTRQLIDDAEERKRVLTDEKHNMQLNYQTLKQRINYYRTTQQERLIHLSNCAEACKLKLKEKLDIGKSVLTISELTQADVALSATVNNTLSTSKKEENRMRLLSAAAAAVPQNDTSSLFPEDISSQLSSSSLDGFYMKYNSILEESLLMDREEHSLMRENQELKQLLKQYQRACHLTNDTLQQKNTLLIVNGKTNINPELLDRQHTCTSTSTAIKASSSTTSGGGGRNSSTSKIVIQDASLMPHINGSSMRNNR